METRESKPFSIYNANEIGLNFQNLKKNIELGLTKENILIWSTMESDLPGGNSLYDFKDFNELCNKYDVVVNIVFGLSEETYYIEMLNLTNIKVHFWPTYLLYYTYKKFDGYYDGIDITRLKKNTDFKELFVCYNNKPHSHRCRLIDKLYKNNLFNDGIISWNEMNNINYEFTSWEEKIMRVDEHKKDYYNRTNHIVENTSFLFLVTESTDKTHFITEKTFKPILIEQPFICFGGRKQNIALREMGFQLYDEIFDYEFDYSDNIDERIDGIIYNLNKIKNSNYFDLYEKIKDKIKFNKERAINIVENKLCIPEIVTENKIPFES